MPRSLTGGELSFRIADQCGDPNENQDVTNSNAPHQNGGYLEDRVRCLEELVERLTAEVRALQIANTSQADVLTELTRPY